MKQDLINLKQRIDKNYKRLQRRCLLTKPILGMINQLLDNNETDQEISKWLVEYSNTLNTIKEHLKIIEQKYSHAKQN